MASNCPHSIPSKSHRKSNSNSLSGTILEYYTKYGQNRDLEKYLRFRRGQSSSGSSIQLSDHNNPECPVVRLGRSLENLSVLNQNTGKSDNDPAGSTSEKLKSRSNESIERHRTKEPSVDTAAAVVLPQPEVMPKTTKSPKNPTKSKKKSFNFNMESNIIINVSPPLDGTPAVAPTSIVDKKDFESQTDEPPIPLADISTDNLASNASSPASVSNKQNKLEWDSMADVGYTHKSSAGKLSAETSLSTSERKNLKKFFADRGLDIDDKLIVLAAQGSGGSSGQVTVADKATEPQNDFLAPAAISPLQNPPTSSKWKTALKKFRDKYKTAEIETPGLCITDPQVHSTPINEPATDNRPAKKALFKEASVQFEALPKQSAIDEKIAETMQGLIHLLEKSCQTSAVEMASKEVQVSKASSIVSEAPSSDDNTNIDLSGRSCAAEKVPMSASSFEFVSPKTYENAKPLAERNANKENEVPTVRTETSSQLSQSTSGRLEDSYQNVWQMELKKGIGHLNALLDANEIDIKTKKRQMRKIVLALFSAKYSMQESRQASTGSASKQSSRLSEKRQISGVQLFTPSSTSAGTTVSSHHSCNLPKNVDAQQTTMKDWLQPMTHSEIDFQHHHQNQIENGQQEMIEKLLDAQRKHSNDGRTKIDWIDQEMARLASLKARIVGENVSADIVYENIRRRQSETVAPTVQQTVGQLSLTKSQSLDNKQCGNVAAVPKVVEWDSHKKYSKTASVSRTKLQTPADFRPDNGIAEYAREKRQQFIDKYETNHGKLYGGEDAQQEIYTQPCSEHYSDPRDTTGKSKSSSKLIKNDAYTSIVGSDIFLSSNSVSVPGVNSSSHTTTHQYDTKTSVAIQTGDSLRRTAPIFGAQEDGQCECSSIECSCACKRSADVRRRRTIRVPHMQNDKQQQTVPEPIAYVLTFDSELSAAPPMPVSAKSMSSSSSTWPSSVADSKLTLRQHLQNRRPDVVRKAEDRRQCLQEIHSLRLKQSEQRNKLLMLTSSNTLRKFLARTPSVATTKRAFTSKVFRAQTKRQYMQLPEVVRRRELEQQKKLRKSQRIISDLFKKNLQKRALIGKPDLSNSMTLIPI